MDEIARRVGARPAAHQPTWDDGEAWSVRRELSALPALVRADDVATLRGHLALVAAGEAHVVQAGDCAEDPAECVGGYVDRKARLLDQLADRMTAATGTPVLRVGRIAGQFAKPRSHPTETVGGVELPVYRGHMVNGPEPSAADRRQSPRRMLSCHLAAAEAMARLGWPDGFGTVWTSHEALLLDYELAMLRPSPRGPLLGSTHWPWVGERTRQADGAHVALLAEIVNPVACKVGPSMTPDDLLDLCARLDPDREPGRLTLIARMGSDAVRAALPALVAAVRAAGHPVIWLCDPMHGNTSRTPDGLKTRYLHHIADEITGFGHAVRAAGGVAGGLHLETTPDDVTECVNHAGEDDRVADKYTSLCDPRLNPDQALSVVTGWAADLVAARTDLQPLLST
ncbi:3-deoxy-7-phosphoheptulonate synthase [Actinokineospora sp. HUAS TT18]|uniref:3-deoxy-7-phosphoheptulonate synthase n=1 Tax=Actinokineospora sp. HUAS TT18 TaxID=3447451 RepID=UPI003F51E980